MKKATILIVLVSILPFYLFSQYNEGGVFVGTSNYFGDLQPGLEPTQYHLSFGIFGRRHLTRKLAIKSHFYKGDLSGSDGNHRANSGLRERHLNFRSTIMELAVQGEYNLSSFSYREKKFSSFYVFLGVAGIYFNPQAQMQGDWYDLQPLGTEGQGYDLYPDRKSYSKFNFAIPAGLGIRLAMNEKSTIGFEVGLRRTFTDYLDDVSGSYPDIEYLETANPIAAALSFRSPEYFGKPLDNPVGRPRGNTKTNDWYVIAGLSISVNLINDKYELEWEEKYKFFRDDNY